MDSVTIDEYILAALCALPFIVIGFLVAWALVRGGSDYREIMDEDGGRK